METLSQRLRWRTALLLCAFGAAACGTRREFVELSTGDHKFGTVWSAVDRVANSDGFRIDLAGSDRGLGIYQSRWDRRVLGLGRSGRRRLYCEIVDDRYDDEQLMVRFYVEQQHVQDLGLSSPAEDDWDDAGQDGVYQRTFYERLVRFLGLDAPASRPAADAPQFGDR